MGRGRNGRGRNRVDSKIRVGSKIRTDSRNRVGGRDRGQQWGGTA